MRRLLIAALAFQSMVYNVQAISNPASNNCIQKGGSLIIEKDGRGGAYGICVFDDNRQCEEWALLHGDCPIGGIKIIGYLTREAVYCALRGGKLLEEGALCQLPSRQICMTQDYYMRNCP